MDTNYKRAMQVAGLFLIITIGSLMRLIRQEEVRGVTLITAISAGVALGVLITNAVLYYRSRK